MKLNPDRLLRPLVISLLVMASLWLIAVVLSRRPPAPQPQVSLSPLDVSPECLSLLTRQLLTHHLPATVRFTPAGTVLVTIPYHRSPDDPPDQGAQVVWTVFDAVTALPATCPFRRLEVTVAADDLHMQATVSEDTLHDWSQSLLDEEAFIDQVIYIEVTPSSPHQQ